jgi:hypothetical protein
MVENKNVLLAKIRLKKKKSHAGVHHSPKLEGNRECSELFL